MGILFDVGETARQLMSTSPDRSTAAAMLLLVCCASTSACQQVNPAFDPFAGAEGSGSESSGVEAETTEQDETSESSGVETGTAEHSEESESGPESSVCGDGVVAFDEACDDGNEANDDGCMLDCRIPESCAEILEFDSQSPNGTYLIDPDNSGLPWPVACDMVFDGGGWTGFVVQDTCNGNLVSVIEPVMDWDAEIYGIDDACRPFTEFLEGGALGYTWDIEFPPGFEAFFLRDYAVKAIGTPELLFAQEDWMLPAVFPNGALSFGDANDEGPTSVWILEGGDGTSFLDGEVKPYPALDTIFDLEHPSATLRIGWGERGLMKEGLYPWWSGRIFLR